jgi:cysteine desulfurase / selenocysteine lyase
MSTVAGTALVSPSEFPTLAREGLVYLDAAATSQTPQAVLAAMDDYYRNHRASVHRGVYAIASEATDLFEGARARIAAFAGSQAATTVFTRNATEALNLVARGVAGPGDKVVVTEMEHHSNLVPWQMTGAEILWAPLDEEGRLRLDVLDDLLSSGDVKAVAVAHVSNVVGTINPVAEIARRARAAGALSVVDGSQAVPQLPVDVGAIDADFYAWTGHKAYGPTGIGVLHGRPEALEALPPLLGGGHMIARVAKSGTRFAEVPTRFEAGTSAIAEAIGLGAAVDFLSGIGMEAVRAHEQEVTAYALERLRGVEGLRIHGPADPAQRGALVSFALEGIHPHDVAEIIGSRGVCVRAGHHCAQVLMDALGEQATTRASFSVHSTRAEVDALLDGLARVQEVFA